MGVSRAKPAKIAKLKIKFTSGRGCGAFAHLARLARENLAFSTVPVAGKFAQAAKILNHSSTKDENLPSKVHGLINEFSDLRVLRELRGACHFELKAGYTVMRE
jgi:hypothetical protein